MPRLYVSNETLAVMRSWTKSLVMRLALEESAPPELALAIAKQESAFNPFSVRYESGLARQVWFQKSLKLYDLDSTDWRVHSSFGPMQILVVTAYGAGYQGAVAGLVQPELSTQCGLRYLRGLLGRYQKSDGDMAGLENAISAYNAGSPIQKNRSNYVAPVMKTYRALLAGTEISRL